MHKGTATSAGPTLLQMHHYPGGALKLHDGSTFFAGDSPSSETTRRAEGIPLFLRPDCSPRAAMAHWTQTEMEVNIIVSICG